MCMSLCQKTDQLVLFRIQQEPGDEIQIININRSQLNRIELVEF